jgi:hypothetical protein
MVIKAFSSVDEVSNSHQHLFWGFHCEKNK